MASEEAKAMLDALMGADRNAPLPPGAAVPTKSRNTNKRDRSGGLVLPGKRHKSCYDKDIDPLYTAWGVDVYELFVNTKSDLGANPYIVDEGARDEFRKLPIHEQDRLGFNYFLFQKLSELVRQCDRTVNRNKEKLKQELNRKLSQRGGQDFVEDVDDGAVEMLARGMVQLEDMTIDLNQKLKDLDGFVTEENHLKADLEHLLEKARHFKQAQSSVEDVKQTDCNNTPEEKAVPIKQETDEVDESVTVKVKLESDVYDEDEKAVKERNNKANENGPESTKSTVGEGNSNTHITLEEIHMELGRLTLQKQRVLFDIGRLLTQIAPFQESVETQRRQLNYVRSDISTDKTVCEVSGNFMSARDADERIAAHYAGKQYVGWKLVRDKLASMIKKYGPYGPPPPGSGRGGPSDVPPSSSSGRPPFGNSGPRRGNDGGGGYRGGGGPPDRGGGGPPDRGGGFGPPGRGGGPPERGRWERGGGAPPSSYHDRGGPRGPPPRGDWRR